MQFVRLRFFVAFVFVMISCANPTKSGSDSEDAGPGDTDPGDTEPDGGEEDLFEALFAPDHLIEVEIELAPEDWETLLHEGRGLAMQGANCIEDFSYTYFEATATIDGKIIEHVGVRKKGYLGSLSVLKPSVKINFGKFNPGQTYAGMKRMTLNNDRQDPSHTHQVMSYDLFRSAGIVAPRCNLAHVTINGVDMGIYSHVEAVKKPFLARHFEDDDGNLYEGQVSDFTPELVDKFQRKTNEDELSPDGTEPDCSDLDRVVDALQVSDEELIEALEEVIDLDAFLTFWAMEVITGHWDGYTGDRNNFYIYHDPTSDLFYFIPWGTDGAFAEEHVFLPDTPDSVYAWSRIAFRLYSHDETRALYQDRLRSLLEDLWREDDLLAEAARIDTLVSSEAGALEEQRTFLSTRKTNILKELDNEDGIWIYPSISEAEECKPPVEVSGTFNAVWSADTESWLPAEDVSLELTLNGDTLAFWNIYNRAGPADPEYDDVSMVGFYAVPFEGDHVFVSLLLPKQLVAPGKVDFHGFETVGMVGTIPEGSEEPTSLNYIGDGSITFDTVGTTEGDKVQGSFTGMFAE